MGRSWEKSQNTSDRMAGKIDRELAKGQTRKLAPTLAEQIAEMNRPKGFDEIYPSFGGWERDLVEHLQRYSYYSSARNPLPLTELNERMGTTGTGAYQWVRTLWESKLLPTEAARQISESMNGRIKKK
jgi:hypothetical protein